MTGPDGASGEVLRKEKGEREEYQSIRCKNLIRPTIKYDHH